MRLKTSIWVAAYLRRCQTEGVFGAVRKKGAEEAGAVFVKVALMDGNAMLYAPAPQTVYDDSRPAERLFVPTAPQPVSEPSVEERLTKELRFDPDAWIVETEDRAGPIPTQHLSPAGKRIASVQRTLTEYGYGQLKPTGTIGADTQHAIAKFERARKLPVTGQMSDRLVRELGAMIGHSID